MSDLSDYIRYSQPSEEGRAAYRAQLAAAERRGYQAAIAKLRDRGFNGAADYLETTKETTL